MNSMLGAVNTKYQANSATIEVPTGYKMTEVGIIPEEWNCVVIGELITDLRGGAPFKPSDFTKDGVKVLPKGGVIRGGLLRILEKDQQFCSPRFASKYVKNRVNENYTIVVLRDLVPSGPSIGLMVRIPNAENFILAQGVYGFLTKNQSISAYLIQYSNTNKYRRAANEIMVGSTQVHITNGAFKEIKIAIPSDEKEQTAIANALSDVDALIQELEKLIAKKQAIKTATMQQLLTGRTRLPPFGFEKSAHHPDGRQKGYKPSELGEIPEDWEILPFNKIFNYQNGKAQEHLFNSNDGYKVISIGNYSESGKYIETGSYIDKKHIGEISRFVLKTGELAMILNDKTAVGTIIGRVILIDKNDTYVMNQRTMRLSPTEVFNSQYLFALINSEFVHKRIVGMAKPGTQIYINTDDVLEFQVQLPTSMDEQAAIAKIHIDMDKEVQILEHRLAKTRQIKQGMMQELLTGKTRLVKPAGAA